ncbi:MAG: hypothetical protein MJ025_06645 [Victivallaceae bacterium]|nr:hypothetical protein [Victivallaceae bacterium]
MTRLFALVLVLAVPLVLAARSAVEIRDSVPGGCSAIRMAAFKQALAGGPEVSVVSCRSDAALKAISNAEADIVIVPDYAGKVPGTTESVFSARALAVCLSSEIGLHDVSFENLMKLWTNPMPRWTDIGVEGGDVRMVLPLKDDDMLAAVEKFMGGKLAGRCSMRARGPRSAAAVVREMGDALAFTVYSENVFPGVEMLSVDGVAPTQTTIADGSYKPSERYKVILRNEAPAEARSFVELIFSDSTSAELAENGFLPVRNGGSPVR